MAPQTISLLSSDVEDDDHDDGGGGGGLVGGGEKSSSTLPLLQPLPSTEYEQALRRVQNGDGDSDDDDDDDGIVCLSSRVDTTAAPASAAPASAACAQRAKWSVYDDDDDDDAHWKVEDGRGHIYDRRGNVPSVKRRRLMVPRGAGSGDAAGDDDGHTAGRTGSKMVDDVEDVEEVEISRGDITSTNGRLRDDEERKDAPRAARPDVMGTMLPDDPIVCWSSPVVEVKALTRMGPQRDDTTDFIDMLSSSPGPRLPKHRSATATAIELDDDALPDSDDLPDARNITAHPRRRKTTGAASQKLKVTKAPIKSVTVTRDEIELKNGKADHNEAREHSKAQKAREKEDAKERKRLEKEAKAREKVVAEELKKVNVLRTNKKMTAPEMIVDLPSCLDQHGKALTTSIQAFLRGDAAEPEIDHTIVQSEEPIIRWRRKVEARWNTEKDRFEPVPAKYIEQEDHLLYYMPCKAFVDLVVAETNADLDARISDLKARFPTSKPIFLIEGLVAWQRKNKNVRNKQFADAVRSHVEADQPPPASQGSRKKRAQAEYIDDDLIEDALLRMQIQHKVLMHQTAAPSETAQWVFLFTQHLSTIPYQAQKTSLATTFCMDSGQVKAGDSAADTYVRMLQEMMRVTKPIAYGIAEAYPSPRRLRAGFRADGALALQDLRKGTNAHGAVSDRRVGPAVSRRLCKVFLGTDPSSMDV